MNDAVTMSLTYACGWYLPGEGEYLPTARKGQGVAAAIGLSFKPAARAANDNGVWYVRLVASARS